MEQPELTRGLSLPPSMVPSLSRQNSSEGRLKPLPISREMTKHVVTRWYRAPELILLTSYSTAIDIWSVACIFAELLSMEKESFARASDRQALFPGRSCFPLSAESAEAYKDGKDQLNVIFDVIGTPTQEEIDAFSSVKVRSFIQRMTPRERIDLRRKYKGADPEALDLLSKMLQFDPKKRPTAAQALQHPYLAAVRDERATEEVVPPNIAEVNALFAFENDEHLDKDKLRALMRQQVSLEPA